MTPSRKRQLQLAQVMYRPEKLLLVHVHLVKYENLIERALDVNLRVAREEALLFHYRNTTGLPGEGDTTPALRCARLVDTFGEAIQRRVDGAMQRNNPADFMLEGRP